MIHSTERIRTTHVGSLVRPPEVVAITGSRQPGELFTDEQLSTLRRAIASNVRMQVDCGIDVPSDGEYSKLSFGGDDRLAGFEPRARDSVGLPQSRDRRRFAEAYEEMYRTQSKAEPPRAGVCTGPIAYRGQAFVEADIANFKAALGGVDVAEAFMPAVGPSSVGGRPNQYYRTREEYLFAIADAMRTEYRMIVDAGFILQIDDPRIVTQFDSFDPEPTAEEYRRFAELGVEALNHALAGIPEDRVRYHVCWGSWHGPHTTDIPFRDIAAVILKVRAQAFCIESANPRHAHEYHYWEDHELPDGKIIIPGVIAHTTRCVEHPELVADRIVAFAGLVGRENVIAGVDCGFAQSYDVQRVHSTIMWEKFRVLAEGARLATKRLWGSTTSRLE